MNKKANYQHPLQSESPNLSIENITPTTSNFNLNEEGSSQHLLQDNDLESATNKTTTSTSKLDEVITKIGFGKFQRQMLILCGFGWLADNMWLQCVASILPRVQYHFKIKDQYIGLLSSSIFLGMMLGALVWGVFSDVGGRRPAFNWTLAVASFFGVLASIANSFFSLCICLFGLGFGVGGNMPVDGALFLEFIPADKQYLLTFLSVFFSFGAALTSFLAWLILPKNSCSDCDVELHNNGWRYLLLCLGLLNLAMVIGRVVLFHLPESPKFLLTKNRADEAVVVLRKIVRINGDRISIHLKDLQSSNNTINTINNNSYHQPLNDNELDYNTLSEYSNLNNDNSNSNSNSNSNNNSEEEEIPYEIEYTNSSKTNDLIFKLKPLFSLKYRLTTILVWLIWTLTSFAYTMFNVFLPDYLERKGGSKNSNQDLNNVYWMVLVYSLSGIPGSILGSYLVETSLGRKGSMALSSLGGSLGLWFFIQSNSISVMVITSSIISFLVTILYAVIYAYTPEVFEPKIRGTGCGVASALSRVAGILAPIITSGLLHIAFNLPNYISAISFFIVALCAFFLPIETKGRMN